MSSGVCHISISPVPSSILDGDIGDTGSHFSESAGPNVRLGGDVCICCVHSTWPVVSVHSPWSAIRSALKASLVPSSILDGDIGVPPASHSGPRPNGTWHVVIHCTLMTKFGTASRRLGFLPPRLLHRLLATTAPSSGIRQTQRMDVKIPHGGFWWFAATRFRCMLLLSLL
jgi:hypothetical protein